QNLSQPADGNLIRVRIGRCRQITGESEVGEIDRGVVANGDQARKVEIIVVVPSQSVTGRGGRAGQLRVFNDPRKTAAARLVHRQCSAAQIHFARAGQRRNGLIVSVQLKESRGGD